MGGLFSHLNIFHAITRAVGIPDRAANVISTVLPVTALIGGRVAGLSLYDAADKLLGTGLSAIHHNAGPALPGQYPMQPGGPGPQYNVTYVPPSYGGGGGSPFDSFGYSQPYNPYGGASWAYSTPSIAYSPPQYQTSQASSGDRTWEDLASLALPFLL